jgi:hypothetical protein
LLAFGRSGSDQFFLSVCACGGSGALLFGAGSSTNAQAASPALAFATDQSTTTSSEIAATPPPAGYLPYTNQQYHFSVYYPPNLQVHTYSESGDALTVALQDPTTNAGFEVYVTPTSGTQITEQEFKLDEPSGVENQPTHVTIAATMFYGNNSVMGDTREIWFIHGGFLYEVTTYKQLDSWLAPSCKPGSSPPNFTLSPPHLILRFIGDRIEEQKVHFVCLIIWFHSFAQKRERN